MLDCEYEMETEESGFVLKWLFNGLTAYQWIVNQKPIALSMFKGRVDTTYQASDEKYYKYRTLVITKPLWNMTGEYKCSVQTFQSSQKQSAHLQMIVPESEFTLNKKIVDDTVVINCGVDNVFPQPKLSISVGDKTFTPDIMPNQTADGLFDLEVEETLWLSDLESPTTISCALTLPGTNYTRRKESVFYGNSSSQTNPSFVILSTALMLIFANLFKKFA